MPKVWKKGGIRGEGIPIMCGTEPEDQATSEGVQRKKKKKGGEIKVPRVVRYGYSG